MPDDRRPNPDALLSSIQREEAARKRGKLKVFLGMSPGMGKTYAMLEAARSSLFFFRWAGRQASMPGQVVNLHDNSTSQTADHIGD